MQKEIILKALDFETLDEREEYYRVEEAFKDGGFALTDPATLNKFRKAFKNLIA